MPDSSEHKRTVREEFTKQATAYAANARLTDPERVERLIRATDPEPDARVLDVATGPGHVAFGFGERCCEVVGLDLTRAPLAIAERTRREHGAEGVHFQRGDAETLPFAPATFDVVVCRLAIHHFEEPPRVLDEMARVCRADGTVAVADLVVSEHPDRGAYQNRFERLRDPSHVRALPIGELLSVFAESGLEVETVTTGSLVPAVEEWLDDAGTPASRAAAARKLIERDAAADLSGTRPFRRDGDLRFVQRTATVVGRRLETATPDRG